MAYLDKEAQLVEEKRLVERWEWLTEDIDDYDLKLNTAMVLENSYDEMLRKGQLNPGWLESMLSEDEQLTEAPTLSTAAGSNLIPRVMFPMIRRVYPTLIANKLVSVQPLTAPTGVIYYMVYTYTGTKGNITAADEYSALAVVDDPAYATWYTSEKIGPFETTIAASGNDTTIDCGTKISALLGLVAASINLKRIEVYNASTYAAYTTVLDETATTIDWAVTGSSVGLDSDAGDILLRDVADTEANAGQVAPWDAGDEVVVYCVYNQEASDKLPEMEFSIGSETVTATERKLKIRWTKEAEQDMKAYHKIDVESELVKMASMEMNYEVDREILTFISDRVISALSFLHDWTADAPNTGNNTSGNFLDRHRALTQKMHQVSATIAQYNRQGPASWAVVSPRVAAVLQMLPEFKGEISGNNFNIFEAGKLGGNMSVFVDPNRVGALADEILLGFKSNTTTYGAGVVYAPYTNWMSNVVTDPDNFNSIRGFFSRYAIKQVVRGQYFYGKLSLTHFWS